MNNNLKKLYKKLELIRLYEHAMGIMSFDFETSVPKKAMDNEGDTMSFFSNECLPIILTFPKFISFRFLQL